ncbi:MAG: SDR family oxidoreductase [Pseudolysinimonas sp.]|uniref:SDR family NAD(P)-dependent oxidoreductase n=1 Tax=Pseudolysinimonas sp. TaxID=2680009 RepID=UPI0032665712
MTEKLVAIVTGGAGGIGQRTVALLRERGFEAVIFDRDISAAPDGIPAFLCDITDDDAVKDAVDAVVARFGRLDVVVNNAGIGATGDVTANDAAEWHRVFDVNVVSIARMSVAALPHLRRSPHPVIVNVSSIVETVGVVNRALYSATKGAVSALTLAMAADHLKDGIRVNAVAPGTVDTAWVGRLIGAADDPVAAAEALRKRQPIGRLVTPDEVALAIAYLVDPAAGSTTGLVLLVDGGMGALRV